MAYSEELDDRPWEEVALINTYALFIGYITMAIKGLGFLILTWTTVVLLGGFITGLRTTDFWCITFITLVQTAGIFNPQRGIITKKLEYIVKSAIGSIFGVFFGIIGRFDQYSTTCNSLIGLASVLVASVSVVVQTLVLTILICPLAATYMFGLLISTGISIWRLVKHDYGSNSVTEANLKPAMDTLYYLALLQGALFCYRFFFGFTKKGLAKVVMGKCNDNEDLEIALLYLDETRAGCEKDPLFERKRNLITHAVDLIGSKSHDDCVSGVKMLYTSICVREGGLKYARLKGNNELCHDGWKAIIGRHMMMKNLIISTSSSFVLQKLLQTLDPWGAFDRETRNQGAVILGQLALDIQLEQFPGVIQYICTLIGSFEEYRLIEPYHRNRLRRKYDQNWDRQASRLPSPGNDASSLREAYEKLVLTGLCILRKLATHEKNCRIMSKTPGLLPRIMAPVTSDMTHAFDGGAWSARVVQGSLQIMLLLVAAPGKTGAKFRREISSNKEAISTMERILNCSCCHIDLQKRAMGILIHLYMDTMSRKTYPKMLVDNFSDDTKDRSIRKLAGEALAKLCIQDGSISSIIVQVNSDGVGSLIKILLLDDAENKSCRIRAAQILEQMCIHHTQRGESLSKLKKDMIDTMPKVLSQILCKDKTHALTEATHIEFPEKEVDIENQCDNPQDNALEETSSIRPQNKKHGGRVEVEMVVDELDNDEEEELHAPLLSLCVTICDTFISADQDLSSQFGAFSLPKKVKEMVAENNVPTAPCLRLMKLACKMVISMMKHRGSYKKEDLESLKEALSSASEGMSFLDISMVFASEDDGPAKTMKPVKSLGSLVKEAKESVEAYFKAQESGNIEPFTSTDG
ncbi:uncharacterized protein LOC124652210 isoform X2 [Lolium rigidum]|uniref:uncharacterized protein LOC124652210 isoform X2 n=1 Tax=Lolium rigidum TaxID=89674 RepID=UPI001F5DD803|nr:uncharacterized protein LOC124652210 isoform X2 [Lolium rigidum]